MVLKEFCIQVLDYCFNPLMKVVKVLLKCIIIVYNILYTCTVYVHLYSTWLHVHVWQILKNLSIVDTVGTNLSVLIKEMSSVISEVVLCTKAMFGTLEIVLIIEVSFYFRVSTVVTILIHTCTCMYCNTMILNALAFSTGLVYMNHACTLYSTFGSIIWMNIKKSTICLFAYFCLIGCYHTSTRNG